jgi:hypothetical protein
LKTENGAVSRTLKSGGAKDDVMQTWRELVKQEIVESVDDTEFE